MSWFRRDEFPEPDKPVAEPERPLTPGICECGHIRSCHVGGTSGCCVGYPPDKEWPNGAECACKIFILDPDGDDDDDTPEPTDPEVKELERLERL